MHRRAERLLPATATPAGERQRAQWRAFGPEPAERRRKSGQTRPGHAHIFPEAGVYTRIKNPVEAPASGVRQPPTFGLLTSNAKPRQLAPQTAVFLFHTRFAKHPLYMKLRIENNDARQAQFGRKHQEPQINKNWIYLPVEVKKQERSNWCWAAIGVALSQYYYQTPISQENLVRQQFNKLTNQSDVDSCNQEQRLDEVLQLVSSFSHWSLGKPAYERISAEINAGRPLCARIQWLQGGSHYVLIKGYCAHEQRLLIEDSLTGSTDCLYEFFPKKYLNRGAVWIETFWTEKATQTDTIDGKF